MAKQENEKNSELMKSYERIRSYMRRFYIYGFESKDELSERLQQSKRTYDNERRRIESWLGDYMRFRSEHGKIWYITLDTSSASHNPLYDSWKAKSFTAYDIMLYFYMLDILRQEDGLSPKAILEKINDAYLSSFANGAELLPDIRTVDIKLQEYSRLGLLQQVKKERGIVYSLVHEQVELAGWQAACAFFSEATVLGEVGSFILDRLPAYDYFAFKHHFFLYTLDSGILYKLLAAMEEKKWLQMEFYKYTNKKNIKIICCPLKLYCSTQTGRQYVLCYDAAQAKLAMYRLDRIKAVRQLAACGDKEYEGYLALAKAAAPRIWGVSLLGNGSLDHLEFTVYVGAAESYILRRLQREKRSGVITQVDAEHYRFSVDVYDARELLPWLRTFIMRITALECSNESVKQTFMQDLDELSAYYSGEGQEDGTV